MKLELYYYAQCPFCQRVLSAIKSAGVEKFITLKNTLENKGNRDFHQRKTGRNTVPCLYIDDTPMFESSDIINWVQKNAEKIKG